MSKKIFSALIAICIVFSAAIPCFAENDVQLAISEEYEFTTSEEEQNVSDRVFIKPVTVKGEGGTIGFNNCFFVYDVTNEGVEGAVVRMYDCRFALGARCVIRNDIQNANMETPMPKFLFIGSFAETVCDNVGAVVGLQEDELLINGEWHDISSCDLFLDMATGEFGPYSGQADERNDLAHNYCMWVENGEQVHAYVAVPID